MSGILVVSSNYYAEVSSMLLEGATSALREANMQYDVVTVPGSFEIPQVITFAVVGGRYSYDGYVALGCVIRGETDHYKYVCSTVSDGLKEISIQFSVPIGFGVITCFDMEQALERANPKSRNFGGNAAKAVVSTLALYKRFTY